MIDRHMKGRLFAYKQILLILESEEWTMDELKETLADAVRELESNMEDENVL